MMSRRIPDWTEDELILALDLYLHANPSSEADTRIVELSGILRKLPYEYHMSPRFALIDSLDFGPEWEVKLPEMPGDERRDFRSPDAVYFKMDTFNRIDPSTKRKPTEKIPDGAIEVWDNWADRPDLVRCVADMLREQSHYEVAQQEFFPRFTPSGAGLFFPEGEELFTLHRKQETDPLRLLEVKKAFIVKHSKLTCEVCGFDFQERYGEVGRGFIEVHHDVPVDELTEETEPSNNELRLVCSNCHGLLHRKRRWMKVDELNALLTT